MRSPEIRGADELLAGSSAICPATSIVHGHRRRGLVQISLPLTRVTAADARRIAKALRRAAKRAEGAVEPDESEYVTWGEGDGRFVTVAGRSP